MYVLTIIYEGIRFGIINTMRVTKGLFNFKATQ